MVVTGFFAQWMFREGGKQSCDWLTALFHHGVYVPIFRAGGKQRCDCDHFIPHSDMIIAPALKPGIKRCSQYIVYW